MILSCADTDFLDARIEVDEAVLLAVDPAIDLAAVRANLGVIPLVCRGGTDAGPIGVLPARGRFRWLVAPRSTIIQPSAVHTGRTAETIQMLQEAGSHGALTVAVTNDATSPLAESAEVVIQTAAFEQFLQPDDLAAYYSQVFASDLLYVLTAQVGWDELWLTGGMILFGLAVATVPALIAYRRPVIESLTRQACTVANSRIFMNDTGNQR